MRLLSARDPRARGGLFAVLVALLFFVPHRAVWGEEQIPVSTLKEVAAELRSPVLGERERAANKLCYHVLRHYRGERVPRLSPEAVDILVKDMLPALLALLQTEARQAAVRAIDNVIHTGAIDKSLERSGRTSIRVSDETLAASFKHKGSWGAIKLLGYVRPLTGTARKVATHAFLNGSMLADAAVVLAQDGVESRVPLLRELVSGARIWQRRMAAEALAEVKLTATEIADIVAFCRGHPGSVDRQWGVRALAMSVAPHSPAAEALASFLDDRLAETRSEVARTLGRAGGEMDYLLPRLRGMLGTSAEEGACEAIASIGAPVSYVPLLAKKVGDERATPSTRRFCMMALARLGRQAQAALPVIRSRIKAALDDYERMAAVEAAEKISGGRR